MSRVDLERVLDDLLAEREQLDWLILRIKRLMELGVVRSVPLASTPGEVKPCITCKEVKPRGAYYMKKNNRPTSECKKCSIARSGKWQRENRRKRPTPSAAP